MNLYDETTQSFGFKFYMNEVETPIYEASDSTLTVVVPENISTGLTYLVAENQVFYGPSFTVLGNLTIDSDYDLSGKTISGPIYDALESRYSGQDNNFYLAGGFRTIGGTIYNGLAFINHRGVVASNNSNNYKIECGFKTAINSGADEQAIYSISYFDDGQMLLSGLFSSFSVYYDQSDLMPRDQVPVNNVVVLEKNAAVDTVRYTFNELVNSHSKFQPLSAFNGGTNAAVTRSFVTKDQKVILVGNFKQYFSTEFSAWYSESVEKTNNVTCVVRTERNGLIDEIYRNVNDGYTGIDNGVINDAYIDDADGVVIVGTFTSFDGVPAPGIVRLDADGNVDRTYMANIGKGADNSILKVRYNASLHKAAIAGTFSSFNGQSRHGVALLDDEGQLDEQFVPRNIEGGGFDFATLLNCNKIVASGTFRLYDGVPRQGFVILEPDGAALQKYNVPGQFSGELFQVVETVTSIGNYGLLLLGEINRFNGKPVNNAVMLEADFSDNLPTAENNKNQ